jgi:hypothetical protein
MQYNFGHYLLDIGDGQFFFNLEILPLASQNTLYLLLFIIKIKESIYGKIRDIAY